MEACNHATTPVDRHIRLEKSRQDFEASATERRNYQSAVGSLMYAMLGTRPDISYAVSKVSKYPTNSNSTPWTAVKRIFWYLVGSPKGGIGYTIQGIGSGFMDADWGSGDDRKSIGVSTFILNGASISWNSKKQTTVALSSTEAEYMALTHAITESIWLQALLLDLGARRHLEEVSNIYIDNQGALALATNPEFHARTKHINIQYHFVRHHLENEKITLTYCRTSEMKANIFTKALPQPAFTKHNLGLGLINRSVVMMQETQRGWEETYSEQGVQDRSTGEGRCS